MTFIQSNEGGMCVQEALALSLTEENRSLDWWFQWSVIFYFSFIKYDVDHEIWNAVVLSNPEKMLL